MLPVVFGAFAGARASAEPLVAPSGQANGLDSVVVEGQSPWVESGQDFHLHLQVASSDPATDKVQVQVYSRLTTRSAFDAALLGRVQSFVRYGPVVTALNQLQADPQGGYDVDIPVNPSGISPAPGPGVFPPFSYVAGSAVFPVQVGLYNAAGILQGSPVTTFLVYAAGQGSATGLPKLNVAAVVPVRSPPSVGSNGAIQALGPPESARLQQLVTALTAHQDVPVSLGVSPLTIDVLQAGSQTDRATASTLASLGRAGGDEVLPATFARVSMSDLLAAGLGGELSAQFDEGAATLARFFGRPPEASTWVFDAQVDQATVGAVAGRGAERLVLPDGDLSPLPAVARQTTFAFPTRLIGPQRGGAMTVYAGDPGLSSDFSDAGGPVLAADHLLAELAMIQLETPGITRGVAVVPPARWRADPHFVDTFLGGLAGHPLLQAVTVSGLFDAVKTAQVGRTLAGPGASTNTPAGTGQDTAAIDRARQRVGLYQSVLVTDQAAAQQLDEALLAAESSDVTESQRKAILAAIQKGTAGALQQVTLPRSSSITLTSTRGQIPLTILSAGGLRVKVELRLSSQRLIFRPFAPPGGHCRVPTPTREICDLVVAGDNTTLKVPVEARSSGVFPMDVSLWTPGGGLRLAREQNTVRSTAVSNVGLVLIIVAVLSLALWWGRDLRHGRRARRLVPPPHVDEAEIDLQDPLLRDFFANPPPGYAAPSPSPSPSPEGDTPSGPRT